MRPIDETNLPTIARKLAKQDLHLKIILDKYGPPPLWAREPGFATLLQIILEQQVSLASAKACFDKLARRIGAVTPENVLNSTDGHLKADGFSRQKTTYARHLAGALVNKHIDLNVLNTLKDDEIRSALTQIKGIGQWTSDIYLLMALRRPDVMPKGDIALHTAWHKLSGEARPMADEFLELAERWRPYRSVAARMLWHFYLSERNGRHL
jgi:DNA-3-methyladenine glycosylase II